MDFQKIKQGIKENKIILGIILFSLLIRVVSVYVYKIPWWDETVYYNLGQDLVKNPLDYSFNYGWGDYSPDGSWPLAGYRAPLLPYFFSFLSFIGLKSMTRFMGVLFGTATVYLTFILGNKFFNKKTGIYASLFLSLLDLHIIYSGRMLTDVYATFFILLTLILFWKGFEERQDRSKLFFGISFALAVLCRYNSLWLIPFFAVYLAIRKKLWISLKDKSFWKAVIIFLIIISPLFIYGFFVYNNPLGPLLHGSKAAAFWGGISPWYYYFFYWFKIFKVMGLGLLISLGVILLKKDYKKKEFVFILLFISIFILFASIMPHKEERHLLPLVPFITLLNAFLLSQIKKISKLILFILVALLIIFTISLMITGYSRSHNSDSLCFVEINQKIKENLPETASILNDNPPLVRFYTGKNVSYYFTSWNGKSFIKNNFKEELYVLYSSYDFPIENEESKRMKEFLDRNSTLIYSCEEKSWVYKI